jgi:hypothetical protein
MNTLPPEWRPTVKTRPVDRGGAGDRPVGTAWQVCPLSGAWDRVTVRADHRILRSLDRVAAEWDRVVHRGPLAWLRPHRRDPIHFSEEDYARLTAAVPSAVLERTMAHIGALRRQRRSRCSLRAVALLELVETVVAWTLDERRRAAAGDVVGAVGRQPET